MIFFGRAVAAEEPPASSPLITTASGITRGIDNRLIEPAWPRPDSTSNTVECAQRLGGMLRFYHRAAA